MQLQQLCLDKISDSHNLMNESIKFLINKEVDSFYIGSLIGKLFLDLEKKCIFLGLGYSNQEDCQEEKKKTIDQTVSISRYIGGIGEIDMILSPPLCKPSPIYYHLQSTDRYSNSYPNKRIKSGLIPKTELFKTLFEIYKTVLNVNSR